MKDVENLSEDVMTFKGFYKNRVTHILIVFFLSTLGAAIGNMIAIPWLTMLLTGRAPSRRPLPRLSRSGTGRCSPGPLPAQPGKPPVVRHDTGSRSKLPLQLCLQAAP